VTSAFAAAIGLGWGMHALLADPAPRAAAGPAPPAPAASAPLPASPQPAVPAARDARPSGIPAGHANLAVPERVAPSVTEVEGNGTELWRERLAVTQKLLEATPGDRQAIQLVTVDADNTAGLENFLLRASKLVSADGLLVYSVKFGGRQHYRVAYGNYPDAKEALAAVNGLPAALRAQGPYPRSFERMRSQNRQ
jgi:septal ring-binding cell division protein DamX